MVISCSAYGCSNKWSPQGEIHFHKFPFRSRGLCERWVSALKRKDFVPTRASLVCSVHFREEDYVNKPELTKKRLKNDAVPSIFNFPVNDMSSTHVQVEQTEVSQFNEHGKKRRNKKIYNPSEDSDFEIITKDGDNVELTDISSRTNYHDNVITFNRKDKSIEHKDIDSFIRELVVYEEVDMKTSSKNDDNFVHEEEMSIDDIEDDLIQMAEADEDDKCYILGSIWGERLKQLPSGSRSRVKKIVNQVFEEARKGTLNDQFNTFEQR